MDRFSFIMALLSIIVGLGLTELLTNIARQIKLRRTIKSYWVQSVLAATIFIALLQQWWEAWGLQRIDDWSFPILLIMLGGPVGLYIIANMLFPEDLNDADIEAHYYANARAIWIIAMFTVVTSVLFRPLSFGDNLFVMDNANSAVLLAIFAALAITKNHIVHAITAVIMLVLVLGDILAFNLTI